MLCPEGTFSNPFVLCVIITKWVCLPWIRLSQTLAKWFSEVAMQMLAHTLGSQINHLVYGLPHSLLIKNLFFFLIIYTFFDSLFLVFRKYLKLLVYSINCISKYTLQSDFRQIVCLWAEQDHRALQGNGERLACFWLRDTMT